MMRRQSPFRRSQTYVLATLLLIAFSGSTALADVEADIDAEVIESGREALNDSWSANWYDSASDDVARVNIVPPPEPKPANWNWNWLRRLFSIVTSVGSLLKWSVISLLILLLVGMVYWLFRTYYWRDQRRYALTDDIDSIEGPTEADRVEALPINLRKPRSNLLDESQYHYEQGDYNEAIVYLYSYFLVQLDLKHFIRLARGKTNRQYMRELQGHASLKRLMENSMILFEDAFFGHRELTRDQFEFAFNRVNDFHQWTKLPATQ